MTAIVEPTCSHRLNRAIGNNDVYSKDLVEGKRSQVLSRCHEIISFYEEESFRSDNQMARWLVQQLSHDEREVAAQCSYAYWYIAHRGGSSPTTEELPESKRFATAMREAIRHKDCAEDRTEILRLFRATLAFHRKNKTTIYRSCMTASKDFYFDDSDDLLSNQRRDGIDDEMTNYQTNVIRGHDREDRAIFFAFPRRKAGTVDNEQAFVDSITYTLERAIASSEYHSIGRQDQIVCILDTKGASCPPLKIAQAAVGVLQNFYPSRLKTCVILNPPYLVTALHKMLKPFMHPITASKFLLMSAKELQKNNGDRDSMLFQMVDESQAMPVLMPGRGKLTSSVNVEHFLYQVPFYRLYDAHYDNTSAHRERLDPRKPESTCKEPQDIDLTLASTVSISSESISSCDSVATLPSPMSVTSDSDGHQQEHDPRRVIASVRSLAVGQLVLGNKISTPTLCLEVHPRVINLKIKPKTMPSPLESPHIIG